MTRCHQRTLPGSTLVITNQCPICLSSFASRHGAVAHLARALQSGRSIEQHPMWPSPVAVPGQLLCPVEECKQEYENLEALQRHIRCHLDLQDHHLLIRVDGAQQA